MDLRRILQATPGTLSQQWTEGGDPVDPGTVTIGIVRADGAVLVAAGTATAGTGTGPRTYNLTTTHTALLDRLTVTWTSTLKGTLTSFLEVAGGFLFTEAHARRDLVLADATTYPDATIEEARVWAEDRLEEACGVAFVPRYARQRFSGQGGAALTVGGRARLRSLRDGQIDDVALTPGELAQICPTLTGFYRKTGLWARGVQNIVLGYEHGYDYPPGEVTRAAVLLAKDLLVAQTQDPRVVRAQAGEEAFTYATDGTLGIPEVDRVIAAHKALTAA